MYIFNSKTSSRQSVIPICQSTLYNSTLYYILCQLKQKKKLTQKKRLTVQFFLHKSANILLGASRLCRPCHSTFRIQAFLCKVRRRRDYIRELLNLCRDQRAFKFVFASFSGKKAGISGKAKKKNRDERSGEKGQNVFSSVFYPVGITPQHAGKTLIYIFF